MAKGYVGIPTSYTPVEYIESSGTQYINTNVKTDGISKIQAVASNTFGLVYSGTTYGGSLFGARVSVNDSNFQYANGASNEFVGNGMSQLSLTKNTSTNTLTIEISKTSYSVASQNYNINGTLNVSISTPLDVYLFGLNNNGALSDGTWKIMSFKMYDNSNNLIRDFIPAVDGASVACLYERVEGKFYYNQGTGSFTVGNTTGSPVVIGDRARRIVRGYVGVKEKYTPLEYIESTGTQYIDTGLAQNGYHSVLDVSFANFTNLQIITGTYGPNDNQRYYTRINTNGSLVTQFGGYSGNNLITGPTLSANTRYAINTKLFNGAQSLIVDGTTYGTQTISGQTFPTANIYLFGLWGDGSPANLVTCKMYGAKYYDASGILIRDFIPVVNQDNVACLYEQVEGKFYYNKGTGTFTAGSTTGQAVSLGSKARKIKKAYVGVNGVARLCFQLAAYTELEYIESTGTQWIETGVVFTPDTKSQLKFTASAVTGDALYGFGTSNDNTDYRFFNYSNRFYFDVPGPGQQGARIYGGSLSLNTIYEIELGNFYIKNLATGTNIVSSSTQNFTNTSNTLKMWYKDGNISKGKLYYLKIWSGATLQRDFIPVLDSDNIPCLYDKVEGKFYYNKGTGTFNYGTINSLNTIRLMNTGSLVGMGDRTELLANELAGKDVENTEQIDEQVKNISTEPIETKTEGSGDTIYVEENK